MPSVCPWVVLSTRGFRCAVFSVLPVPMACGMKRRDCLENLKRANTTNEIETLCQLSTCRQPHVVYGLSVRALAASRAASQW